MRAAPTIIHLAHPKIRNKGLEPTAVQLAGWVYDAHAGQWAFPTWRPGEQNPAPTPITYKMKPYLPKGNPDGIRYYLLRDSLDAIRAAGFAYLASGVTDHLAYRAAGIPNVFSWFFGEQSIPPMLVADLAAWGASRVVYLPNLDRHGTASAEKLAERLAGSGITLDCRKLPTITLPDGKPLNDVCDVWQIFYTSAPETAALHFHNTINCASAYTPAPPMPVSASTSPTKLRTPESASLYAQWRESVLAALDRVSPPLPGKQHRHCPNPHHADKNPSFRIQKSGAPVCNCENPITWHRLAEWVGAASWEVAMP